VFSWETRRTRRSGRDRRRPDIAVKVEALEERQLLAFNVLGMSLPDLTVQGFAPSVAAWGAPMAVTVNVHNIGVATMLEPLALAPGSTGSADAPASVVGVFASRFPHSLKGSVLVGTVDVPAVAANDTVQVTQTFTMPPHPAGLPGDGGRIFLTFKANSTGTVFESDTTNNQSKPVPVTIEAPLPELTSVGFDAPPRMQPGDTIQPTVRIANLGTADSGLQGDLTVQIWASPVPRLTSQSIALATATVPNVPAQSLVPSQGVVLGDANLAPPQNIVTIAYDPFTLPTTLKTFYIGVVIDPLGTIKQLSNVSRAGGQNPFQLVQKVGPPIPGLPPAGVNPNVATPGVSNVPVFPIPFNNIQVGAGLDGTFPPIFPPTTTTTTTAALSSSPVLAGTITTQTIHQFPVGTAAQRRKAIVSLLHG
jgi:hypothetical protein